MITLRLFKSADPFQEIDSRPLESGSITLGRDASADWQIEDSKGDISRRHCTVRIYADVLYLCDHSKNGVWTGPERRRAPRETDHQIRVGETFHIGEYLVLVDQHQTDEYVSATAAIHASTSASIAPSTDYRGTDASMLEAFCDGAGVDRASFIGEDPAALMARLGALYRQAVDDLSILLGDRAALKDSLHLDRTTISARDNNPLKWSTPERVAVDLIKERETGFLKGADAMRASFEDLRRHNASLMAGSSAAVAFVLRELAPEAVEAVSQKPQALGFLSRGDAQWKAYQTRHKALTEDLLRGASGQIGAVSREAYQETIASLEAEEIDTTFQSVKVG